MRCVALLLVLLILCGCSIAPEATTQSQPSTTAPTVPVIATTETTAPPDPILQLLDSLSTEQKVGQLFLARCPDVDAIEDIQEYHLGGYILFGKDFDDQTPESIADTIATYQSLASLPMLIAVDEEGGSVCRVSSHSQFRSKRFSSIRKLYNAGGIEKILEEENEKCQLLASIGINVNMAPVCDITTDPDAFMYQRSLGQSPAITAQCIEQITQLMATNKIGSVLKHFPGYGNNKDTHIASATDDRSISQLEAEDLLPFVAGINAGCDAILVSHTTITALDSENPASLSPAVISYLRDNLQFNGVIITDDLAMSAITKHYAVDEAAVMAVHAGIDMLCASDYQLQYKAVLNAVQSKRISEEQLNAAVYRILQWKVNLGLIEI